MKPQTVAFLACGALISACVALASGNSRRAEVPTAVKQKENKNARIYAELNKAPEKARNRLNPLASDPNAVAAGRLLFEDHCSECHGINAEGGKKAPSLRVPEVQTATDGALFWLLTNGVVRKGMPVWSKLPEPQRWALVRYVKSLDVLPQPTESTTQKH